MLLSQQIAPFWRVIFLPWTVPESILKKGLINWVMQALGVTMFINMSSITIPPQNGYPPAGKSASFIHDFPSYELPFSAGISHDM